MSGPATDVDVPAWWQQLGLPGLADIHVHFLPPPVMDRVWEHFDAAGPLLGRPWRGDEALGEVDAVTQRFQISWIGQVGVIDLQRIVGVG